MATLISSTSSLALMVLSSSSRSFFLRVYILFFMLCVFIDFLGILHFIGWVREHELKKEKNLEMGLLECTVL